MSDSEALAALKRAGGRAAYHLARAAIEWLKAVEAVVEELGSVGRPEEDREVVERSRIDIEVE